MVVVSIKTVTADGERDESESDEKKQRRKGDFRQLLFSLSFCKSVIERNCFFGANILNGGLLKQLTKQLLERAMAAELTQHVGYEKHDSEGDLSGNLAQCTRAIDARDPTTPGRDLSGGSITGLDFKRNGGSDR